MVIDVPLDATVRHCTKIVLWVSLATVLLTTTRPDGKPTLYFKQKGFRSRKASSGLTSTLWS